LSGNNLAYLELLKTAALFVRDYEWEQVVEGQELSYETYFTTVLYGWLIKLKRRTKVQFSGMGLAIVFDMKFIRKA